MIEAMACGTPVIAFRRGSAPEVVDCGLSGFLVDDVSEAAAAVRRIPQLDRAWAREAFERRFDIEKVAREYVQIYRELTWTDEAYRGGLAQTNRVRVSRPEFGGPQPQGPPAGSEVGHGATIKLYLPRALQDAVDLKKPVQETPRGQSSVDLSSAAPRQSALIDLTRLGMA
jgi:hypothetical protein